MTEHPALEQLSSASQFRKLRIGIATSGRFHMLDLARELDAMGHEVHFYSYVPVWRGEKFKLPKRCNVSLLPFIFPLVFFERFLPRFMPRLVSRLLCWSLDTVVSLRLRPCDVFLWMSGIYVKAPQLARERYGAKLVVHRGSQHILAQRDILAKMPDAEQPALHMIKREMSNYELADRIMIPSIHVSESFDKYSENSMKLFLNNYGVDVGQFPLYHGPRPAVPTVLFVGNWSYQKGVDVLVEAVMALDGVQLAHVGAIVDAPFPDHPRFVHHNAVPQWQLKSYYQSAHVLVLPSRQDGFGVVISQALASGLLVVCTDRTGGPDLATRHNLGRLIRVVPTEDADRLRAAIKVALDAAMGRTIVTPIRDAERSALTWHAFAVRHVEMLNELLERG